MRDLPSKLTWRSRLKGLGKKYGDFWALREIDLEIEAGSFTSIIGPSGAGKTSLLKVFAGLLEPDEGSLELDGNDDQSAVLVFQDFWLFPGLNVEKNIAFGLEARRLPKQEIRARVTELLQDFGIHEQARKFPRELSAGQQQRVALARALALRPSLLLLDEPFAHLDLNLKSETARYLRSMHEGHGLTTLCVTHDVDEAFIMSDRIGVMDQGRLLCVDSPLELLRNPPGPRVAAMLGPVHPLSRSVFETLSGGLSRGSGEEAQEAFEDPEADTVWIRPERVELARPGKESPDSRIGTVIKVEHGPSLSYYLLSGQGWELGAASLDRSFRLGDRLEIGIRKDIEGQ